MRALLTVLTALFVILPCVIRAEVTAVTVSKGPRFDLKKILKEEGTTIVVFIQDTSTVEQQFLRDIEKDQSKGDKLTIAVVRLKDLSAPAAQQYSIKATPTAVVYDRFARELARTSVPDEIRTAVRKGLLMARIKWVDEDDPKAFEVYGRPIEQIQRGLPGIVKTMALRPEAYKMFNIMSDMHFSDGFLKRREHEMVAAYVSALNKCKF